MAPTLKFGAATSNEGFTPLSTASFSDLRPARIVRELIQNSVDAAVVEGGERSAVMRFQVEGVTRQRVPDFKGYNKALDEAIEYQLRACNGRLPDAAQQVVNHIRNGLTDLQNGRATLLSVVDNGIGLDTRRMNSLLGDGSSAKSENASGSYGVGHLASMSLSDIRYMLYGGVTHKGHRIVAGRAVLASHRGRKKLNAAQGYLIDDFRNGLDGNLYNFLKPPYPDIVNRQLDQIAEEWGHGSVVMMLVFNNFRSRLPLWEIVSKVASYNFCSAIYGRRLLIKVTEDGDTRRLDRNALERVLAVDKQRVRSARSKSFFEGLRPSGQNAYSILKTLTGGRKRRIETKGGAAYLTLTTEPPSGMSRVDLFRNGMWITDDVFSMRRADFVNRQPFHAVIEIEAKESGDLHRLIRKAEGPMHDTLSFSLLADNEEAALREALKSIADFIKEQIAEIEDTGYLVDDFLMVSSDAGVAQGRRTFSFWGVPTVTTRNSISQMELPGVDPTEVETAAGGPEVPGSPRLPKRHRPKESRKSTPLPFRSTVAPDGDGKLTGLIESKADYSEIWIMLRVDENTDVTCDRIWHEEELSITSFAIAASAADVDKPEAEIDSGGKMVKVRGLAEHTTYKIHVEYAALQGLVNAVDAPVLRLELHRPPAASSREEETRNGDKA